MEAKSDTLQPIDRMREVLRHDEDPSLTGRPATLILAGALLAAVSLVLCAMLARQVWLTEEVPRTSGTWGVSVLFVLFVGGAYAFSLGYQLYDVGKALRLTLIIALFGVAALALFIGALAVLAWLKHGGAISPADRARPLIGIVGIPDAASETVREERGFMVACKNCTRDFIPVPPTAICPWCDTAYLSA